MAERKRAARDGKPAGGSRPPRKPPGGERKAPSGARLTAAQQALRDTLAMTRQAQGWTWAAIAAEAGVSEAAIKRAVAKRRKDAPLRLGVDPVRLVENLAEGYVAAVGDFEAMASAALADKNHAAAVGAKKGALDAQEKLMLLAQATGRLPQDLGVLRHLLDLRAIAEEMLGAVDRFAEEIADAKLPKTQRAAVDRAAARVRSTFAALAGQEERAQLPAA